MFNRKWLDQINKKVFKVGEFIKKFDPADSEFDSAFKSIMEASKVAEGGDFNPCEHCAFRDQKLDMQMEELLEDIEWFEDEDIDEIDPEELLDMENINE